MFVARRPRRISESGGQKLGDLTESAGQDVLGTVERFGIFIGLIVSQGKMVGVVTFGRLDVHGNGPFQKVPLPLGRISASVETFERLGDRHVGAAGVRVARVELLQTIDDFLAPAIQPAGFLGADRRAIGIEHADRLFIAADRLDLFAAAELRDRIAVDSLDPLRAKIDRSPAEIGRPHASADPIASVNHSDGPTVRL